MKIAPRGIEPFLAAPDKPYRAALVFGVDTGLVRERAGKIKAAVLPDINDPFALVEMSEASLLADPARLADELLSVGLMASKRLVVIRDASDKIAKIVQEAGDCLHASAFLLITADELSTRSSLRAWFEAEDKCAAVACYRDEARDIQSLIQQSFSAAGITASRDITDYLAGQLGNDRYVTRQELEKIITFAGDEKTLKLEEVQSLVDYNRDTQLDDIVHAVADKNLKALESAITAHLCEGTQPVAYLRALQRYFNRLYYIRSLVDGGQSVDNVIAGLKPKVFYKHVPTLTRHAHQWEIGGIVKALKLLIAAELACKTSDMPIIPASSRRLLQVTQVR